MFFQLRKPTSKPLFAPSRVGSTFSSSASTKISFLRQPTDNIFPRSRVELNSDDVEYLKSIFQSCVESDRNHVILRKFIHAVAKSPNLSLVLGHDKAIRVQHEIGKLDGLDAHAKMVSWAIIETLIKCNTLIGFPIASSSSSSLSSRTALPGTGGAVSTTASGPPTRQEYLKWLSQIGLVFDRKKKHAAHVSAAPYTITTGSPPRLMDTSLSSPLTASPSVSAQFEIKRDFLEEQRDRLRSMPDDSVVERIEERMKHSEEAGGLSSSEEEEEEEDDLDVEGLEEIYGQPRLTQRQQQLVGYRFEPLSAEDSQRVTEVLQGPDTLEVLIEKFNIDINRNKILCLKPFTWLNDEVINFYMEMLKERDRELCRVHANRRPSHYFNSFFITKLLITDGKYNYSAVARWTKRAKVDIFECEKVYCPVNISNTHWTMLIMYMQKREIHYYDSMSGNGHFYLNGVLRYLEDEHQNKKGTPFDKTGWRLIDREAYVPQQNNGTDCGVFSIVCADFVTDDLPLVYSQETIPLMRRKIVAAILRGELGYPIN